MGRMTSEKASEMEDKFNQMASGGSVDGKQLGKLFRSVGLNPTEAQVAEWRKEAGGSCNKDTFLRLAKKKWEESHDSVDEVIDCFAVFDKDGEGFLSAVEFQHILTNMGEALSEREMSQVMQEVQINSSGKINYKVFADEIFSTDE